MKTTQIILLSTCSFLLFSTLDSQAQQVREMYPLEIHDFECLQSLQCAQSSQSLKNKGWTFIFDETVDEFTRELTARMKGENISFLAKYDKQGEVIRSTYKQNNAALPTCLLEYLSEGNYEEWQITGSEMVMRDFDATSITYKVKMKNKTTVASEEFDFEFINDLHQKYEGLAKLCLL